MLAIVALVGCHGARADSSKRAPPAPTASKPAAPKPAATPGNPCFPGAPAVAATAIYQRLEKYAWSLYASETDPPPPPTTYGRCKVDRNKVTAPDGSLVVELGCGVRVVARGIYDQLGLQLGAHGKDVLARHGKPTPLTCYANGPDLVRCHFDREEDSDLSTNWYVVAGTLGEDPLSGQAARDYFSPRAIVELDANVWCH